MNKHKQHSCLRWLQLYRKSCSKLTTLGLKIGKKEFLKKDFQGKGETGRGIIVPQRQRQIRTGQKCLDLSKLTK
jgi:hypothetical protein